MAVKNQKSISTSHALNALLEAKRALTASTPAASAVGAGLRSLVSISKAVGLGGKLPATLDNVSSNTKWVLNQLGINTHAIFEVGRTNKSVAAAGQAAVNSVFGKVAAGKFTKQDIPLYQPPLENLNRLSKQIFVPKAPPRYNIEVSPYAMDLFAYAPKYKFLFVVQFTFSPSYQALNSIQRQFAFLIKKTTRPSVKYTTDDVNYYNYRSKYITKTEFDEMSMTFYDDSKNSIGAFFTAYTRAMSPILNHEMANPTMLESLGIPDATNTNMASIPGIQGGIPSSQSSGSSASLADNNQTIIDNIKLYHVHDYGRRVNVYTFHNPRLTALDLDDMDMSSSDVNTMDIKFVFDGFYVDLDQTISSTGLTDITTAGLYPLRENGSSSGGNIQPNQTIQGGPTGSIGSILTPGNGLFTPPDLNSIGVSPLIPEGLSIPIDNASKVMDITKFIPDFKPSRKEQLQAERDAVYAEMKAESIASANDLDRYK